MTSIRRRDRTMVFRLSQDEYESLLRATSQNGGRSVSDFIRTAVLATVENGMDHKSTSSRLRELEQRIRRLETAYLGLLKEGA
jgi:predicted DNA-binding protein